MSGASRYNERVLKDILLLLIWKRVVWGISSRHKILLKSYDGHFWLMQEFQNEEPGTAFLTQMIVFTVKIRCYICGGVWRFGV